MVGEAAPAFFGDGAGPAGAAGAPGATHLGPAEDGGAVPGVTMGFDRFSDGVVDQLPFVYAAGTIAGDVLDHQALDALVFLLSDAGGEEGSVFLGQASLLLAGTVAFFVEVLLEDTVSGPGFASRWMVAFFESAVGLPEAIFRLFAMLVEPGVGLATAVADHGVPAVDFTELLSQDEESTLVLFDFESGEQVGPGGKECFRRVVPGGVALAVLAVGFDGGFQVPGQHDGVVVAVEIGIRPGGSAERCADRYRLDFAGRDVEQQAGEEQVRGGYEQVSWWHAQLPMGVAACLLRAGGPAGNPVAVSDALGLPTADRLFAERSRRCVRLVRRGGETGSAVGGGG